MLGFLRKFKLIRDPHEYHFCCIYLDKQGLSIAVSNNQNSSNCLIIEYLNFIPFPENPTFEHINYLLDQYVKEHHLKDISTCCILDRELYRLILIDIPDNIPKGELREASKWLIKDLLDFPMDDLASDLFTLPKYAEHESKAYVCVTKKHMLKIRQQQIISAELNLKQMSILDLALTALTAHLTENTIYLLVSLLSSHSTLLLTMNGSLYLKHDLDNHIDFSNENRPLTDLDVLPKHIENFVNYFLAQLSQTFPVEILVLPTGHYTEIIVDEIQKSLSYPVKKIDINPLFSFPNNTSQKMIDDCFVSLGGLLNMR
jgi:MSHA biogenesis protein MshI